MQKNVSHLKKKEKKEVIPFLESNFKECKSESKLPDLISIWFHHFCGAVLRNDSFAWTAKISFKVGTSLLDF